MMPPPNFAVAMATLIWPPGRMPSDTEAEASVRVVELLSQSRVPVEPPPASVVELLRDMASSLLLDPLEPADVQAVMTVTALLMQREGMAVTEALTMRLYDLLKTLVKDLEGGAP